MQRPARSTASTAAGTTGTGTAAAWACPSCRRSPPRTAATPCSSPRPGRAPACSSGSRSIRRAPPTPGTRSAGRARTPRTTEPSGPCYLSRNCLLSVSLLSGYVFPARRHGRRTTVSPMQDRELVAAIVNGDPDGLAEAYDRYAASLYAYCRSMLPDPHPPAEAADAVADTFTIATAKLGGLRDPDQLGSWLRAVARNECLRQAGTAGLAGLGAGDARPTSAGATPEGGPPDGLRERVLNAGADNSPTGRADRVSATHRAGAFGRTGFPKPVIRSGPRWWHEVRRRPRTAAGVAAVAVAVAAGGIIVLLVAGGTHRAQASTVALGGGNVDTSGAPSAASSPAGGPSSPGRGLASAPG